MLVGQKIGVLKFAIFKELIRMLEATFCLDMFCEYIFR